MNITSGRYASSLLSILLAAGTIAAASAQTAVEQRSAAAPSTGEGVMRSADGFVTRLWERTAASSERAVEGRILPSCHQIGESWLQWDDAGSAPGACSA